MRFRLALVLGLVLSTGLGILLFGVLSNLWYLKSVGIIVGAALLLPGWLVVFWLLQANYPKSDSMLQPRQDFSRIQIETWVAVNDGEHNAFTDMVFWHDKYWLAFISSPSHFASKKSRLVLLCSSDARQWQEVRRFDGAGEDIRDPKLGIIQDKLFVYALLNKRFDPEPYRTIVAHSGNGQDWTPFENVMPEGWLLGRAISLDKTNWYAPAHRIEESRVVLLCSTDGVNWVIQSTIYAGKVEHPDETAIIFQKNGIMTAVTRLEEGSSIFGSVGAATLISISVTPFTHWIQTGKSRLNRLDGPNLFSLNNQIFAVGRRQTDSSTFPLSPQESDSSEGLGMNSLPAQAQGSVFSRKRTALFLVDENGAGLKHLVDLPSSGDTAYAGVVVKDDKAFISYYSNDPRKDYRWLLGMFLPSRIQISKLEFTS